MKLHAKNSSFYETNVSWCCRKITAKGARIEPSCLEELSSMHHPVSDDQLLQCTCAANWIRSCILDYNRTVAPLTDLLDKIYQTTSKRTKKAATRASLEEIGWTEENKKAFENAKCVIKSSVTMAHIDEKKMRCFFTDSSEEHWRQYLPRLHLKKIDSSLWNKETNQFQSCLDLSEDRVHASILPERKLLK